MTDVWTTTGPAVIAAFLASLVEAVEAFTVVIAVSTMAGWRPALIGTGAGVVLLALVVIAFGPLLDDVPLELLQLIVGVLLLLFGTRWLRKAILRAAGILPLHDEAAAFTKAAASLEKDTRQKAARLSWLAGVAAFKAVLLEGLEVVFIVIAVGAGGRLLVPAAIGATTACLVVILIGLAVHKPLSLVPENSLKFGVGVILSAFGVFWTGEGLGVSWPSGDLAILAFGLLFFALAASLSVALRRPLREPAQ
jgi:uncharacterized membrane protein